MIGALLFDVLAMLPAFSISVAAAPTPGTHGFVAMQCVALLKLLRLVQVDGALEVLAESAKVNNASVRLMKLCSIIMLLWHWAACVWWLIGTSTADGDIWRRTLPESGDDASISAATWGPPETLLVTSTPSTSTRWTTLSMVNLQYARES